jgi:hypothetical protein
MDTGVLRGQGQGRDCRSARTGHRPRLNGPLSSPVDPPLRLDAARDTPVGAIRRKIEDLLAATPVFVKVPPRAAGAGRWQLAGEPRYIAMSAGVRIGYATAAYQPAPPEGIPKATTRNTCPLCGGDSNAGIRPWDDPRD